MRRACTGKKALLAALWMGITASAKAQSHSGVLGNSEWTNPAIVYSTSSQPASDLPSVVHYSVQFNGSGVTLRLTKRETRPSTVPVFDYQDGKIVEIDETDPSDQNLAFYQDVENLAAVTLRIKEDPQLLFHDLDGTFCHSSSCYRIRPRESRWHVSATSGTPLGSHVVSTVKLQVQSRDFVVPPRDSSAHRHREGAKDSPVGDELVSASTRSKRLVKPHYEVDLLYVTDYALFQSWTQEMKYYNPQVTSSQVLQDMRYYLAQVENAVDIRYRSINISDWSIGTKLVAFYMVTNPGNSSWTESIKMPGGPSSKLTVDASQVLSMFSSWVITSSSVSALPSFDHAALFTGYDIYSLSSSGLKNYNTIGLSYIGRLCSNQRESVIEFTGALTEGETQAHELGHSLSADHDGDQNTCLATDQYIMTAVSTTVTNLTSLNYFRFSTCSVSSFRKFISQLNRQNSNCMLDSGSYFSLSEWTDDLGRLPGQVYTVDVQCQQAYGHSYAACGGSVYGAQICMTLWCYNTTATGGLVCRSGADGGRGIDGTPCGNHSWCYQGQCAYNQSAPEGSDACPIGDISRNFPVYANQPYTCSNMPASYCYDPYVLQSCCQTCSALFNPRRVGCEYGDWVNCSQITIRACMDSEVQHKCCQFCEDNKLQIPGCEWGDYFSNCAAIATPQFCSINAQDCCASCYRIRYSCLPPSCAYGDTNPSFCALLTRNQRSQYASTCCRTCSDVSCAPGVTTAAQTTVAFRSSAVTQTSKLAQSVASSVIFGGDGGGAGNTDPSLRSTATSTTIPSNAVKLLAANLFLQYACIICLLGGLIFG